MSKPKFCSKCGASTVKRMRDTYDRQTGEQEFDLVCPSQECEHEGYHHESDDGWLFRSPRCVRCGCRLYSDWDY